MCSDVHDREEQHRRDRETKEVIDLIARRSTARIHWGYWLSSIGFTAPALLGWGLLLAHGLPEDAARITLRDGTIISVLIVLACAAIGSTTLLASVSNAQRLAAEQDRIHRYQATKAAQISKQQHAELLDALDNLRGENWRQMMDDLALSGGVRQGSVANINSRSTRI